MVHAAVQKPAVMGHQNIAPLAPEIPGHQRPPLHVQMVCWFVNEGKPPLVQKEGRQQSPGPLPVGEGGKGAFQQLRLQLQWGKLPQQLPLLGLGTQFQQDLSRASLHFLNGRGKIAHRHRAENGPAIRKFPLEQPQQCGLSSAVASHKSQPPTGVDLKAAILKHILSAARIGKRQVIYLNHSHCSCTSCCQVRPDAKTSRKKMLSCGSLHTETTRPF